MVDKIVAPLAIAIFIVFVGFLVVYVNEIDLWIVVVGVCLLALFDFWKSLRSANNGNSKS